MANYSNLINSIKAVIKQNGTNDITGQLMQDVLVAMTNSIGRFATFAGVASPTTNPGTIDQNVFFLASIAGTYPNFGGAVVPSGKIVAFDNVSGSWNMSVVVTISGGAITIDIDKTLQQASPTLDHQRCDAMLLVESTHMLFQRKTLGQNYRPLSTCYV